MATKKAKTVKPDESKLTPEQTARASISPSIAGAAAMEPFNKIMFPDADLSAVVTELKASIKAVQSGDLSDLEAMLVGQAQALQTMFVSLVRKGQAQEYLKQYQTHINLALKAQAQSRATIQALVELKYPRQVVITKQANIANGPQQVNNGCSHNQQEVDSSHEGESQNEQSKLIEGQGYGTMDSRGAATTIEVNQELETMEAINRANNTRR